MGFWEAGGGGDSATVQVQRVKMKGRVHAIEQAGVNWEEKAWQKLVRAYKKSSKGGGRTAVEAFELTGRSEVGSLRGGDKSAPQKGRLVLTKIGLSQYGTETFCYN